MRAAIARLPKKQRATLILRVYHELPHEQIAGILGSSVGAVKANFFHALNNLKKLLPMSHLSPAEFVDLVDGTLASAPSGARRALRRVPGTGGGAAGDAARDGGHRGARSAAVLLGSAFGARPRDRGAEPKPPAADGAWSSASLARPRLALIAAVWRRCRDRGAPRRAGAVAGGDRPPPIGAVRHPDARRDGRSTRRTREVWDVLTAAASEMQIEDATAPA